MSENVPNELSPWHRGERALHEQMGNSTRMEEIGRRVIRDYMPEQHRTFYQQLPFIVMGVVDDEGWPWATLLEGQPGFLQSPDPRRLVMASLPRCGDPALAGMHDGAAIGLLGIELHSRRRNRMNGTVRALDENGFAVQVHQSFGNCPQYIQDRAYSFARTPSHRDETPSQRFSILDAQACELIAAADTFFVASHFPGDETQQASVDVSHRGGKPGFVRIDDNTLTIPDFAGNSHFNTLGNLLVYPRAGLIFVDFENGDVLQLVGTTEIIDTSEDVDAFQGAERLWRVKIEQLVRRPAAMALRWQLRGVSPNNLLTGSWDEVAARLAAKALRQQWRPFRVVQVEDESSMVRSFYLQPADHAGRLLFEAGQHVPLRVLQDGVAHTRFYTLSVAPSDGVYRISVKRGDHLSAYLHDHIGVGDVLDVRAPQGGFVLDAGERRPVVLLAAGIGITPMLAMLRHLVYEGQRTRRMRTAYLIYASRTVAERAFDAELNALRQQAGDAIRIIRVVSAPEGGKIAGRDFDLAGRIDLALLKAVLPWGDHDFYLCGPAPFMQSLYDDLRATRVANDRIHAEAFGPAALRRNPDKAVLNRPYGAVAAADGAVNVQFGDAASVTEWRPSSGSLLDLAESAGLQPSYQCRAGRCGACRTRVLAGEVTYPTPPECDVSDNEALLCCAVPAQGQTLIHLQI